MLAAAFSKNSCKELILNYLIGRKPWLIMLRSSDGVETKTLFLLHHDVMDRRTKRN